MAKLPKYRKHSVQEQINRLDGNIRSMRVRHASAIKVDERAAIIETLVFLEDVLRSLKALKNITDEA